MPEATQHFPRLLRAPQVCELVGWSMPTIYRAMREGKFPLAISIGPNSIAWSEPELLAWVASKPRTAGEATRAAVARAVNPKHKAKVSA